MQSSQVEPTIIGGEVDSRTEQTHTVGEGFFCVDETTQNWAWAEQLQRETIHSLGSSWKWKTTCSAVRREKWSSDSTGPLSTSILTSRCVLRGCGHGRCGVEGLNVVPHCAYKRMSATGFGSENRLTNTFLIAPKSSPSVPPSSSVTWGFVHQTHVVNPH